MDENISTILVIEDHLVTRSFLADNLVADPSFAGELAAFVEPLVGPGRVTSLAQTLLKLTAPGIPVVYAMTQPDDGGAAVLPDD